VVRNTCHGYALGDYVSHLVWEALLYSTEFGGEDSDHKRSDIEANIPYLKKPLPYKECLEGGNNEQVRSSYGCYVAYLLCYCFGPLTLSPNLLSEDSGSLNILVRREPLQHDSFVSFLVARICFHCVGNLYQTAVVPFRIFILEECGNVPLHFVTRKF
jgi:hypothetical protein